MLENRKSGILLHISSLPSKHGIGDLGEQAYNFIDKLEQMGQVYWQILPTNEPNDSNSPYDTSSAFAQNPMFISLDLLLVDGLLDNSDIDYTIDPNSPKIDFNRLKKWKLPLLTKAAIAFQKKFKDTQNDDFKIFCEKNKYWLNSYAAYKVLKDKNNDLPWFEWDNDLKCFNRKTLEGVLEINNEEIEIIKIIQYFFDKQWHLLKNYANDKNISLIGDLPIYVSHDSADVWANQHLFKLNDDGNMVVKSGCPPDYFMEEGQVWGHPIYNWEIHSEDNYSWWVSRMSYLTSTVDLVRFDHFNGILKFWEIPVKHENGINGKWSNGPGRQFIDALYNNIPRLKILAEDLGELSNEVIELRSFKNIPGMKVFQFDYDNISKNERENKVLFTGTHDNDTLIGWYEKELKGSFRRGEINFQSNELRQIIDKNSSDIHLEIIKYCMETEYPLVIIPLQDLIGLESDCRMNEPGTLSNANWSWKYNLNDLHDGLVSMMKSITHSSGRA